MVGIFKERDIERLQIEESKEERERSEFARLQPLLPRNWEGSPLYDSLSDIIKYDRGLKNKEADQYSDAC